MGNFEIIEQPTGDRMMGGGLVKPKDERWKNFAPCMVSKDAVNCLEKVKSFEIFLDDIILTGYPRSGTTIVAEMLWLIASNFNFDKAKQLVTDDRVALLEFNDSTQLIQKGKVVDTFATLSRPRTLKTHLPLQFLPDQVWTKKPRMIYVSRDPRDVVVSMHHFESHMTGRQLNETLDDFLNDRYFNCPYHEFHHNFLNIPNYPNILYLTYESVTSNIDATIQKVADFLGVEISSENFVKVKEHLKFDNMKKNKACNNTLFFEKVNEIYKKRTDTDKFIRRGKAGGYKDEMSQEYIEKFDKWMEKRNDVKTGFPKKH
ncbi:CLUMA_CG015599, isoform A [Clunio marinus]|uniref:CLUMA_CG015599, isoform A n=1 Tax=Clunio marinus TaxID=568069 RepID=A0A1J1IPA3_9DIPT|nr:CLUMA_CG015599, isoform A [Clunio marinus]